MTAPMLELFGQVIINSSGQIVITGTELILAAVISIAMIVIGRRYSPAIYCLGVMLMFVLYAISPLVLVSLMGGAR